jgi:hypothetical protein
MLLAHHWCQHFKPQAAQSLILIYNLYQRITLQIRAEPLVGHHAVSVSEPLLNNIGMYQRNIMKHPINKFHENPVSGIMLFDTYRRIDGVIFIYTPKRCETHRIDGTDFKYVRSSYSRHCGRLAVHLRQLLLQPCQACSIHILMQAPFD